MAEIVRRPFKVFNFHTQRTVGIVATSLQELKCKAKAKFALSTCLVFLEDGTEIEDEEYFWFLQCQSKLIVVGTVDGMAGSQSKLLGELLNINFRLRTVSLLLQI